MTKLMISLFGPNWRTTVAGICEGAIPIFWSLIDAYQKGQLSNLHGIGLLLGIIMIIKGHLSKDKDVTGLPADPQNKP